MKLKFAQVAAATAIAAAAVFAPTAAQAYTTPTACTTGSATVAPGGTVTFDCPDGAFVPGEDVNVSLTGEGATGAALAMLKFAPTTEALGTVSATEVGGIETLTVRIPTAATGTHTIAARSASLPNGIVAYVTVAGGGTGTSGDRSLAATGFNNGDLLGIWVGGGALVLVGGGLAVASAVRRNRKLAAGN